MPPPKKPTFFSETNSLTESNPYLPPPCFPYQNQAKCTCIILPNHLTRERITMRLRKAEFDVCPDFLRSRTRVAFHPNRSSSSFSWTVYSTLIPREVSQLLWIRVGGKNVIDWQQRWKGALAVHIFLFMEWAQLEMHRSELDKTWEEVTIRF